MFALAGVYLRGALHFEPLSVHRLFFFIPSHFHFKVAGGSTDLSGPTNNSAGIYISDLQGWPTQGQRRPAAAWIHSCIRGKCFQQQTNKTCHQLSHRCLQQAVVTSVSPSSPIMPLSYDAVGNTAGWLARVSNTHLHTTHLYRLQRERHQRRLQFSQFSSRIEQCPEQIFSLSMFKIKALSVCVPLISLHCLSPRHFPKKSYPVEPSYVLSVITPNSSPWLLDMCHLLVSCYR